jgi:hypothetical protein
MEPRVCWLWNIVETAMVQDPFTAQFPKMVNHALERMKVHHAVPIYKIAERLAELVAGPVPPFYQVPGTSARLLEPAPEPILPNESRFFSLVNMLETQESGSLNFTVKEFEPAVRHGVPLFWGSCGAELHKSVISAYICDYLFLR